MMRFSVPPRASLVVLFFLQLVLLPSTRTGVLAFVPLTSVHPTRSFKQTPSLRRASSVRPVADASADDLAPPPDPYSNPSDDFFRSLRQNMPKRFQYFLRDSGLLRALVDGLALLSVREIKKQYPTALADFLHLSGVFPASKKNNRDLPEKVKFEHFSYGPDGRQYVELMRPLTDDSSSVSRSETNHQRLVAFIHGGAWGSGWPALYRLAAKPFLKEGYSVAVVGYRTYPSANVGGQIEDIAKALDSLKQSYPEFGKVALVGHSSGAHIGSLGIVRGQVQADKFVGISGVYSIPSHYLYERGRGVERFSPLAPACGGTLHQWKANSPDLYVESNMMDDEASKVDKIPEMLLIHGERDDTVPYSSAINFANALSKSKAFQDKVSLEILPDVEHAETVFNLMFGGPVEEKVLDWLSGQQSLTSTDAVSTK